MPHTNQALCKVRTITLFVSLGPDNLDWEPVILDAAITCCQLADTLTSKGYIVQSVRIVTNPFGEYLDIQNVATAKSGLQLIKDLLERAPMPNNSRIRLAIGAAQSHHEVSILPELISSFGDLCNACVNIEVDAQGILDNSMIETAAKAVRSISQLTPRGEGNFNFTVNFNCAPLIPYFPAAYSLSDVAPCFVVGLETPDLLVEALQKYNQRHPLKPLNEQHQGHFQIMRDALQHHISRIQSLVEPVAQGGLFNFAGFDSSAAPSKDCASMADIYRQLGVEYFGAAGTVEASALLTRVFKSIRDVDLVGFSGLMLALTEDRGLAEGSIQGQFDIRSLLTYSAVCGIGLDTVPIPGDTSITKIAALMRDTGTLAFRLNKPLTVRLFPVPGLQAGDLTAFESEDLCNCAVLAVP